MIDLAAAQNALWEMLAQDGTPCFLRLCATDDALWITDLPRRTQRLEDIQERLIAQGFTAQLDEQARLWRLDWTPERWRQTLDALPADLPALPARQALHGVYALCRLLLRHPAPLTEQPMHMLRRVLKRMQQGEDALLKEIPTLYAQCAERLRTHRPLPYDAGRVLAAWLGQQEQH